MEQQSLRNCWSKGKGAINAWCSIPNAVTAEMMSMNDFDSITIDMQHGLVDYQTALNMLGISWCHWRLHNSVPKCHQRDLSSKQSDLRLIHLVSLQTGCFHRFVLGF